MKARAGHAVGLGVSLLLSLGILVGCNGDDDGSDFFTAPTADSPTVSNLRVRALSPEVSGVPITYRVTATVTDPNDDVVGGRAEFFDLEDEETIVSAGIGPGNLSGSSLTIQVVAPPTEAGQFGIAFAVVDAAGNRSNPLFFTVTIAPA